MVILLVGLTGALGALQQGVLEARLGQNRQQKAMLADATLQRVKLQDKLTFFPTAGAAPTTDISTHAVGASPWGPDNCPAAGCTDPLDFSMGAYFLIKPDGTITRDTTVPAGTSCGSAALPEGTVCREVYTHTGGPFGGSNISSAIPGSQSATTWVRVTRKGSLTLPAEVDIVMRQVVVQ